jgi:hypothetical protein
VAKVSLKRRRVNFDFVLVDSPDRTEWDFSRGSIRAWSQKESELALVPLLDKVLSCFSR